MAGMVDPERRVVELSMDVLCRADRTSALDVGAEVCGGLDDVGGNAVSEVAVRRGLLEEGDRVLKVELVRLVDAADGDLDVVVEAVGCVEDVVVLGSLVFHDRVGSEEGPVIPVQWFRQK